MDKNQAIEALSALAQDRRLDIFRLLVSVGESGLQAGEISARTGCLQNTTSGNLAVLSRARLITAEREGRNIRYRADFAVAGALIGYLLEDCCNGRAEVCAPVLEKLECLN
ncbi:MAG: transcriptional regulator [Pseudomonadota bacterium]